MATKRPTFAKRQREQAAKAKAAAKRDRRLARAEENGDSDGLAHAQPQVEMAEVLARVDALQERLERGAISFEEFDEQKAALLRMLPIE